MPPKAKKIKIKIKKGNWVRLYLPGVSFKFMFRICSLALKHCNKEDDKLNRDELRQAFALLLNELSEIEPFVLAEVYDASENIYVKIETV